MRRAAMAGLEAIAIADVNSVAGIVRAHAQAREISRKVRERLAFDREVGLIGPPRPDHAPKPDSAPIYATPRLIPAARLVFEDAPPVTALPETRVGWASLCRVLSKGRLRAEKGRCRLALADLLDHGEGLQLILHPGAQGDVGELAGPPWGS